MDYKTIPDCPKPVYDLVMPPLRHVESQKPVDEGVSKKLSAEEQALIRPVGKYINDNSFYWDLKSQPPNILELPPSYFSGEERKEIIKIEVPTLLEQCERRPLNSTQLSNIWRNGTFEVASAHSNIRHVWRVAHFLCSGIDRLRNLWFTLLSWCSWLLLKIPSFWKFPHTYHYFRINLWAALRHILVFLVSLVHMLIGIPIFMFKENKENLFEREMQKDRTQRMVGAEFSATTDLIKYFQYPQSDIVLEQENKRSKKKETTEEGEALGKVREAIRVNRENLDKALAEVQRKWKEFYDAEVLKIEDVDEEEFHEKEQKIQAMCLKKEVEFLKATRWIPEDIKANLLAKAAALVVVEEADNQRTAELQAETARIQEEIREAHPIKSRVAFWFLKESEKRMEVVRARLNGQFEETVFANLEKEGLHEDARLWKTSRQLQADFKANRETIYRERVLPQRVSAEDRDITYMMIPPYEVKRSTSNFDGSVNYYFEYNKTVTIKSSYFGFRFVVDLVRLFYYSRNLSYFSLRHLVIGQFGLKGLFWWKSYYTDYSVNSVTGEVKNDRDKVDPVLVKFRKTIHGLQKSRADFEGSPDTGFFGKNVARVFNLIECYIIRLIVVGILGVLIIHPIINLIAIVVLALVAFTSIVWVVVWIHVTRIWGILIFNFLPSFPYAWIPESQKTNEMEKLVKYHHILPLIALVSNLVVKAGLALLLSVLGTVLFPVLSLAWFLVSGIIVGVKYLWDAVVFNIVVRCFAKVPQKDTNLARRIAGPGISRNLYFSLSMEDSVILIQSLLERIQLENWTSQVKELIDFPAVKVRAICENFLRAVFRHGSAEALTQKTIVKQNEVLHKTIAQKLESRYAMLPKMPSTNVKIKFSDSEIQILKRICEEMIKGKLKRLKIEDFVWTRLGVPVGKYKLLVAAIIRTAVGQPGIFETVEKMDERIVLEEEDAYVKRKRGMVKQIMEGNSLLETFVPVVRPKKDVAGIPRPTHNLSFAANLLRNESWSVSEESHLVFSWRFDAKDVVKKTT